MVEAKKKKKKKNKNVISSSIMVNGAMTWTNCNDGMITSCFVLATMDLEALLALPTGYAFSIHQSVCCFDNLLLPRCWSREMETHLQHRRQHLAHLPR